VANARSARAAARTARDLLASAQPGARRTTVATRSRLAGRIAAVIWQRWQVGPWRWRLKHLAWYLDVAARALTPGTRYQHWKALRAVLHATDQAHLAERLARRAGPAGSFLRPDGCPGALRTTGRPPRLPGASAKGINKRGSARR
jgi:hypothetical protein